MVVVFIGGTVLFLLVLLCTRNRSGEFCVFGLVVVINQIGVCFAWWVTEGWVGGSSAVAEELRAAVGQRLAGDTASRSILGDAEDSPLQASQRSSTSIFCCCSYYCLFHLFFFLLTNQ